MSAQIVLNNKKSSYSSPNAWYTVTLTPLERTKDSVTIEYKISAHLEFSASETQYGMIGQLYVGGTWYDLTIVPYGTWWRGTAVKTVSKTITVSELSAAQREITGIRFKTKKGRDNLGTGAVLNATDCADLQIDPFGGIAHINVDGEWKQALTWLNVDGTWKMVLPWINAEGTWKMGI